ncbi:GNAT family N-acetyltransferase [Streptomyces sp. NPDC050448]|uniref:GNAT family N-acetyltransferase n=1 Tax=Streptomyces sp. NPDC050448 TaxID=3155404 RepID=UPI00344A2FAC
MNSHTTDTTDRVPPLTLRAVTAELRPVVERLAQLYRHDMSEFLGHLPAADGTFGFGRLPLFFGGPGRQALLIQYGATPAGFVLTRETDEGATSISAFFVVRALRRRGVGRQAALELLRSQPGRWAIAFQEPNTGAARFWREVATEAVGPDAWHEEKRPVPEPAAGTVPQDNWIFLNTVGVNTP